MAISQTTDKPGFVISRLNSAATLLYSPLSHQPRRRGHEGAEFPCAESAPVGTDLPIHHRAIVGVELRAIGVGITNLVHEFIFVDGDAQARLGGQRTMAIAHRW